MNILLTTKLPREGFAALTAHHITMPDAPAFTHDELLERIADCDILVPTFDYNIDSELIEHAPKLKLIANFGAGFNNIDLQATRQRQILITNTPAPVIAPTAEQTLTLMLAAAHRTAELDRKMRQTNDIKIGVMNNLGISLYGKTLGIVGMGRIGRAVALRAHACGMQIIYHNRHQLSNDIEHEHHATYCTSLNELLHQADFVVLLLPYSPEVHHLIDQHAFEQMKQGAVLVNTARGAIVDEQALIVNLRNHHLWAAALDVYEFEPLISDELKQLDNVVLSPHIGTGTIDGRLAMCQCVSQNILHFLSGEFAQMDIVK